MGLSKVAAVAVGTVLMLAALGVCSSSSHPQAAVDRPDPSSTTTAPPSSSAAGADDPTGDPGALPTGFTTSNCVDAFSAYTALYAEVGGFASGAEQGQLSDFEQKTADLGGKVPEAVREDFRTVAAAYRQYAEAVKGLDFSNLLNADTQGQLDQANSVLNDPAIKAAQARIDDYFTHTCGS